MAGIHRLFFDEMMHTSAVQALRERGVDVEHALEAKLRSASDPELLEHARQSDRILITRNYADFAPLAAAWSRQGMSFPGVLLVPTSIAEDDVGAHVRAIESWLASHASDNPVRGTYGWLPPA